MALAWHDLRKSHRLSSLRYLFHICIRHSPQEICVRMYTDCQTEMLAHEHWWPLRFCQPTLITREICQRNRAKTLVKRQESPGKMLKNGATRSWWDAWRSPSLPLSSITQPWALSSSFSQNSPVLLLLFFQWQFREPLRVNSPAGTPGWRWGWMPFCQYPCTTHWECSWRQRQWLFISFYSPRTF